MTLTTAERIATLINEGIDCSCDGGWTDNSLVGLLTVAQTISAEIDALRDELAVILRERNDAHLALAEARANLRLAAMRIEGFIAAKDDALAEIDGLRAQLSTQADEMIRFTNLANDYATVSQKLAGCESALRLSLAGTEQHYFASPARIDDVRAALAERTRERDEARAEAERLRPAAEAWRQVFELQAKYSTHWRLNDETYWLARFMEEVGELAGALVGNHVGPVEWELSQLAAIALNWLDMRAARARAAKEAKP